jgi:hypothetical protein
MAEIGGFRNGAIQKWAEFKISEQIRFQSAPAELDVTKYLQ